MHNCRKMSESPKCIKHTAFIPKVTYHAVEDGAKGLSDVRNITVVQNDSDTYKVKVYNVESEIHMFPVVPDSVNCEPGEQKPTGDMWTPWCDSQQALEEGHYIRITLSKKQELTTCTSFFSPARMSTRRSTWIARFALTSKAIIISRKESTS